MNTIEHRARGFDCSFAGMKRKQKYRDPAEPSLHGDRGERGARLRVPPRQLVTHKRARWASCVWRTDPLANAILPQNAMTFPAAE